MKRAFTLIESLIVVLVLAIIAAAFYVGVENFATESNCSEVEYIGDDAEMYLYRCVDNGKMFESDRDPSMLGATK